MFAYLKLTASLPLKIDPWKRRFRTWKPPFFGSKLLVLGRVEGKYLPYIDGMGQVSIPAGSSLRAQIQGFTSQKHVQRLFKDISCTFQCFRKKIFNLFRAGQPWGGSQVDRLRLACRSSISEVIDLMVVAFGLACKHSDRRFSGGKERRCRDV